MHGDHAARFLRLGAQHEPRPIQNGVLGTGTEYFFLFRYVTTRLLYTLPVVWLVVSVVFLLIHLVPGDPVQQMLGEGAASADIEAARHAYGLDVPLGKQYVNYWKGVLHGDLGKSLRFNRGRDARDRGTLPVNAAADPGRPVRCAAAGGPCRSALGGAPQSLGRSSA